MEKGKQFVEKRKQKKYQNRRYGVLCIMGVRGAQTRGREEMKWRKDKNKTQKTHKKKLKKSCLFYSFSSKIKKKNNKCDAAQQQERRKKEAAKINRKRKHKRRLKEERGFLM